MRKKKELSGQITLFELDIYHEDEDMGGKGITEPQETKEQGSSHPTDFTEGEQGKSALSQQQTSQTKRQAEPLEEGEIIWSRYGDESGQLKPYVVTSITQKGYIVADCNVPEYKIPVTLRSEGIAWSRTKEIAMKL